MFFYVVSRTYAEIFRLLRICSGLLSNTPELLVIFYFAVIIAIVFIQDLFCKNYKQKMMQWSWSKI